MGNQEGGPVSHKEFPLRLELPGMAPCTCLLIGCLPIVSALVLLFRIWKWHSANGCSWESWRLICKSRDGQTWAQMTKDTFSQINFKLNIYAATICFIFKVHVLGRKWILPMARAMAVTTIPSTNGIYYGTWHMCCIAFQTTKKLRRKPNKITCLGNAILHVGYVPWAYGNKLKQNEKTCAPKAAGAPMAAHIKYVAPLRLPICAHSYLVFMYDVLMTWNVENFSDSTWND